MLALLKFFFKKSNFFFKIIDGCVRSFSPPTCWGDLTPRVSSQVKDKVILPPSPPFFLIQSIKLKYVFRVSENTLKTNVNLTV